MRGHEVTRLSLWRGSYPAPPHIGSVPLRTRPARAAPWPVHRIMNPLLVRDMWRSMGRAGAGRIHVGRDLVSLTALDVATLRGKRFFTQTHGMVEPRHGVVAKLFDRLYVRLLCRRAVASCSPRGSSGPCPR